MADTDEKGQMLGCREACALLGCKKSHFYNLVNSGVLPAFRIGRRKGLRVYEVDCLDYMRRLEGNEASVGVSQAHAS